LILRRYAVTDLESFLLVGFLDSVAVVGSSSDNKRRSC
jgi:hypothetical protein